MDFGPQPLHFRRGPPPFFESTCPQVWAQKVTEWLDAYSWRMGPLKVALNQVSVVPAGVRRVITDGFWSPTRAFLEGSSTICREHIPLGIGIESLGVIGCIFAENGPLEGGIESSFWGTGWGAKGDFMRYSYLYPYIFESRTHTLFESTCPELYAQQSWEWSDAYSWRNDLWKGNFKRVCKKPAGVLIVIWSGFLAPTRAFSKGAPNMFRKHMPSGMGTESLGMIGCIFAENGPLEGGIESSFSGTGWGAKGDFRWIRGPNQCIFGGPPTIFRTHMPWGIGTKCWGMIECIFAENGPLEGGIESSFSGTGWGVKGDFRWVLGSNPCIFGGSRPPFSESTCPEV